MRIEIICPVCSAEFTTDALPCTCPECSRQCGQAEPDWLVEARERKSAQTKKAKGAVMGKLRQFFDNMAAARFPAPPIVPRQKPDTQWWCENCRTLVDGVEVTYQETHDIRAGGCGHRVR